MCHKDNTIEAVEHENVPKLDFPGVFIALISQVSAHFGCFAYQSAVFHTNKQLEQQKAHEQRIAHMMTECQGIWLSNRWTKILFVFLAVYTLIILFYVKFG